MSPRFEVIFVSLLLALIAAVTACKREEKPSIGMATMEADGTLVLDLRAEGEDGTIGDARVVYPPSHPQYKEILQHLGGMSPGEQKAVPPWPDD